MIRIELSIVDHKDRQELKQTMIKTFIAALFVVSLATPAASSESAGPGSTTLGADSRGYGVPLAARGAAGYDDSASIRCLLPPRLTRLGRSAVILAPSRATDTDPAACLKRGGALLAPSS